MDNYEVVSTYIEVCMQVGGRSHRVNQMTATEDLLDMHSYNSPIVPLYKQTIPHPLVDKY